MMDDWKLKTSPVVRLERPNERFVDGLWWQRTWLSFNKVFLIGFIVGFSSVFILRSIRKCRIIGVQVDQLDG